MISVVELLEFAAEMAEVLMEKAEKYEGDYERTTLGSLRAKMDEQIMKISDIICNKIDWDREEVKRRLIHVANFALLAYYKV